MRLQVVRPKNALDGAEANPMACGEIARAPMRSVLRLFLKHGLNKSRKLGFRNHLTTSATRRVVINALKASFLESGARLHYVRWCDLHAPRNLRVGNAVGRVQQKSSAAHGPLRHRLLCDKSL